jgi:glycosyltransferase involved in cell wall biosynthesis
VLGRAIAAHRPDVVSVWNMAGLPGSLLKTVVDAAPARVCVFADAWPERVLAGDPWLGPLARHPTAARVVGRATGLPTAVPDLGVSSVLCFCSHQLRVRIAAATGWDVEGSSITPLGVDRHDFPGPAPGAPRAWSGHLLFVGRLDPVKGIDTLIRALPLLPDTRLRVMGPPEPAHLERLARLAGAVGVTERVEFGSAARSELPAVYEAADACIFPSEWDEPFGIVPLEAMACGTPVVATGRGGSGEFLRDGENAVCFDAGDPHALAAAVARLAAEPALRRHLVAGGLETAAALTVDRLADQLEEIHARAAAAGRSA